MSAFRYRPDIDGLRAISVISVLLFHAGLGCTGGYVGVDVFFVISGYLITGLILKDLDAGSFSLASFWQRRILRIMPAMVAMLVSVLAVGYFVLMPGGFLILAQSAISQLLMSANLWFFRENGYFATSSELKPLLHTWSLAVEEQFYLIFPPLLMGLWRSRRSWVYPSLVAMFLVSFGLSVAGMFWSQNAVFYLLPFRAWEMLAGGLLAAHPPQVNRRWVRELMGMSGLIGIVLPVCLYGPTTWFPGPGALPPVLGAVLIIAAGDQPLTAVGRLLAARPMVFVGLISYSLYLWHWPIMAYMRYTVNHLDGPYAAYALGAATLLSILSWRFVEVPFRRLGPRVSRRMVFSSAVVVSGVLLLTCLAIWKSRGIPGRFTPSQLQILNESSWTDVEALLKISKRDQTGNILLGPEDLGPKERRFLIWGDSHSRMCLPWLEQFARQYAVAGYLAQRPNTLPVPNTWNDDDSPDERLAKTQWNEKVLRFLKDHKEIEDVIFVARWEKYTSTLCVPDQKSEGSRAARERLYAVAMNDLAQELQTNGKTVWFLQQIPDQVCDIPRLMVLRGHLSPSIPGEPTSKADYLREKGFVRDMIESLAAPRAKILDPLAVYFADGRQSQVQSDGHPLYRDKTHLSNLGVDRLLGPFFKSAILGSRPPRVSPPQAE